MLILSQLKFVCSATTLSCSTVETAGNSIWLSSSSSVVSIVSSSLAVLVSVVVLSSCSSTFSLLFVLVSLSTSGVSISSSLFSCAGCSSFWTWSVPATGNLSDKFSDISPFHNLLSHFPFQYIPSFIIWKIFILFYYYTKKV